MTQDSDTNQHMLIALKAIDAYNSLGHLEGLATETNLANLSKIVAYHINAATPIEHKSRYDDLWGTDTRSPEELAKLEADKQRPDYNNDQELDMCHTEGGPANFILSRLSKPDGTELSEQDTLILYSRFVANNLELTDDLYDGLGLSGSPLFPKSS